VVPARSAVAEPIPTARRSGYTRPVLLPSVILLLSACGPNVTALYDHERALALAVATDHPTAWQPDLTIGIASPDLADAVGDAVADGLRLDGKGARPLTIRLPLGLDAQLTPQLVVQDLRLEPSTSCAACLRFATTLDGRAAWSLGPAQGSVPVTIAAAGTIELTIRAEDGGQGVYARVRDADRITVRSPALGQLAVQPDRELQAWVTEGLAKAPQVRVTGLPTDGLPIRDLRLRTDDHGLLVEALSDLPSGTPLPARASPTSGVEVVVSGSTLSGLARRAAYQAGVQQMDIAADPRAVHVEGSTFTMDLRVWRLVGRGWYRDYTVKGDLSIDKGKLRLAAKDAVEVGASPGAGLVDPLAALFEGKILDAIVKAVQTSLPARRTETLGAVQVVAEARSATGEGDNLVMRGALTVSKGASGR